MPAFAAVCWTRVCVLSNHGSGVYREKALKRKASKNYLIIASALILFSILITVITTSDAKESKKSMPAFVAVFAGHAS